MNDVQEQIALLKARIEEMEQKIAQLQAELNCMKERHKHLGWRR